MMGKYYGVSSANWQLDGNSNDISGNSNNGTDNNISYVAGRFGSAASFNGSSSRISLPNNASLKPTTFTIMLWYKGTQATAGTLIQNFRNYSSKYYGYMIDCNNGPVRLFIAKGTGLTGGGTDFDSAVSTTSVNDGNWHFITGTYDGTYIKIYIDSKLENTVTFSSLVYYATQYPYIGVRYDTGSVYEVYYSGLLDGIVIIPYVLTISNIKQWYAYTKGFLN